MWLFTKFGFFSVVNKGDGDQLTVRSRTRGDLDRLRNHYLPSLSPPSAHEGTDYPWRATTSSTALGEAMRVIAQDIDYANFKDEVALGLGKDRAKRYGKIWSALYDMPDDLREPHPDGFEGLPWQQNASTGKALAYGGVVIDPNGYLLMREVKNHFDGYVWTFAKGRQDKGESPRQTALREVREEMGIDATILSAIPGEFAGGTTINRFFLMLTDRGTPDLTFGNRETERLIWATPEEAILEAMINEAQQASEDQKEEERREALNKKVTRNSDKLAQELIKIRLEATTKHLDACLKKLAGWQVYLNEQSPELSPEQESEANRIAEKRMREIQEAIRAAVAKHEMMSPRNI